MGRAAAPSLSYWYHTGLPRNGTARKTRKVWPSPSTPSFLSDASRAQGHTGRWTEYGLHSCDITAQRTTTALSYYSGSVDTSQGADKRQTRDHRNS